MPSLLREVMPSVASALGVDGFDDTLGLGPCTRAVVLLVDGLGSLQLAQTLAGGADLPGLADGLARGAQARAPFPTTTPNGLAALGTGLTTGCHGLVGASFRLPETGRLLWPLGWSDDPHPTAVQPEPTVMEKAAAAGVAVTSVAPRAFAHSGLTRAVLRGGEYCGSDSFGERIGGVHRALSSAQPALVYVYWGDLDKTGHVHGVGSDDWRAELELVDLLVRRLVDLLPPGARLVVTADHGMVDTTPDDRIVIEDLPGLHHGVAAIAGEPRMRHVYARPGAGGEVLAAWRELLAGRSTVLSRAEALSSGLFEDADPHLIERIGDVIAIATGTTVLASRDLDSRISALIGQHGADSDAETAVPLLAWG